MSHQSPARPTAVTGKRLVPLDMLRSVAILIVFFWHYQQHGSPAWVAAIGGFGWSGVDLFFVLSGYLIGGQLMHQASSDRGINFSDFYLRRAFRILPAYLVVLGIYFLIPQFREREGLAPLWRYLTFTQNFGLDLTIHGTFSHAWSLCIEEQFYLLLPVLLLFTFALRLNRLVRWLLLSIFLCGFIVRYYSWEHFIAPVMSRGADGGIEYYKFVYYPTYNRLDGLLAGVSIAALIQFRPRVWAIMAQYANVVLASGVLLLGISYFFCRDMLLLRVAVFGYPMVSVAYGLIMLAALSPACVLARCRFKVFSAIATLAYCTYLTHKQLNHLTREALSGIIDDEGNLMFMFCLVVAAIGGWILHIAVEQPFLRLRTKILKQK